MATTGVAYGGNPETNEYGIVIRPTDSAVDELETSSNMWLYVNHYGTGGPRQTGNRLANTAELVKCLDVLEAVLKRSDMPRAPTNGYTGIGISKEAGLHKTGITDNNIDIDDTSVGVNITGIVGYSDLYAIYLIFIQSAGAYYSRQQVLDFVSKVKNTILRNQFPYV